MRYAVYQENKRDLTPIVDLLRHHGCNLHHFASSAELRFAIQRETYDFIIFDSYSIDDSILNLIHVVRQVNPTFPPVVCLLASAVDEPRLLALESGADLCLCEPLRAREVAARIVALVRRSRGGWQDDPVFSVDRYVFQLDRLAVSIDGVMVPMTHKEFVLAVELFRNLGRSISRGHLVETVWGLDRSIPSRTLDTHISRVRTKLDLPEKGFAITSVYNFGYRLDRVRSEASPITPVWTDAGASA